MLVFGVAYEKELKALMVHFSCYWIFLVSKVNNDKIIIIIIFVVIIITTQILQACGHYKKSPQLE